MESNKDLFEIIHLLTRLVVFDLYEFDTFLKKLIALLNKIIPVESCLIYMYDPSTKQYVLVASKKPHRNLVGKIMMKKGEGITGWVASHLKTVVLKQKAYQDKRFKTFSDLPEDVYEAFLSVPIINKQGAIGVINLQHKEIYTFSREQIKTVEAIVMLIASAFEKVSLKRKVQNLEGKLEERKVVEKAKGLLMRSRKLSENEAFRMIQQEAMKKRKTMKEIAEAILLVY